MPTNGSREGGGAGRARGRHDPGLRAVPDEELEQVEEIVRLDASAQERVAKLERTGSGALGAVPVGDEKPATIDELERDAIEEEDPEDVWEGRRAHSPMGLVVLAGVLGLTVLGVTLLLIPKGDRLVEERAAQVLAEKEAEARSLEEAGVLVARIEAVARSYLDASTLEEKLRYVRHRERVEPLMKKYYAEHPLVPRVFQNAEFYPVAVENEPFLFMQVRVDDGKLVPLLLEQVGEQELKVDWETDVAYQPMALAEFVAQRVVEPLDFRLFVKWDTFYAYEFADAKGYQSVMLTERDSDTYLFGYVERGSTVHERVKEVLGENPGRKEPMLLKLRFIEGARSTRSVLIEEVVAQRWALVNARSGGE